MSEHQANPTARFRRLATASAVASLFSYAAVLFVTPAALNQVRSFYSASLSLLGLLPLATMCGFFVAVISAGAYSDKHGKLPAILAGCGAMALGTTVFAFSASFPLAVFCALLMGVGGGLSEGTAMALISDLYAGSRKTAMMNLSQAAFGLGAVACPVGIGWLIGRHLNWRIGYIGVAALCAASAIVTLLARLTREEKPHGRDASTGSWRELIGSASVLVWALGIMLYVGAELGQSNWMAVYFKQHIGASEALAAGSLSSLWIGITFGRTSIAWISRKLSDLAIIRLSLGLAAVFEAALLLSGSPIPALAASFFLGTALGPVFPTITSMAGAAHPRQSGIVLGIIVGCGSLGSALFTPIIAVLGDNYGIRAALWTCVALLAVNLTLFCTRRRTRHHPPST